VSPVTGGQGWLEKIVKRQFSNAERLQKIFFEYFRDVTKEHEKMVGRPFS
jgi:hypothetical protein